MNPLEVLSKVGEVVDTILKAFDDKPPEEIKNDLVKKIAREIADEVKAQLSSKEM